MNNQPIKNKFFFPSDKYNLSKLPDSIIHVLTDENSKNILPYTYFKRSYDKVVLFLIDGLDKTHLQEFKESTDFLSNITEIGTDNFLTCQFPSTTASNVTTIHTGLSVAQHGIYEWFYYEPLADNIIAPVLFSYARDEKRETLENKLNPEDIYPSKTVYQKLSKYGVKSFVFQNKDYTSSNYSKILLKGAEIKGYCELSEGMEALAECTNKSDGKVYYLFYYDMIDKSSHKYGPESEESDKEVKKLFETIEKLKVMLNKLDENILFILTSDHGQISLDKEKSIYLNQEFPEIKRYIKKSRDGNLIVPAGSPRDMFLYIKDEMLDEALIFLQNKLYRKAIVCKTDYLIENNYFGTKNISNELIGRLGNLAVLPLENWAVWWYEKDIFEINTSGHHGGLSRNEMEIPFLVWDYHDWIK